MGTPIPISVWLLDQRGTPIPVSVWLLDWLGLEVSRVDLHGLEVGWILRIQELDTAYWGFLRVGITLDIFQNIILVPYLEYGVLSPLDTAY
ncbi:hypothetical protein Tco_0067547 [Tanacetum coccineum]